MHDCKRWFPANPNPTLVTLGSSFGDSEERLEVASFDEGKIKIEELGFEGV